jgi:hypothetical protein
MAAASVPASVVNTPPARASAPAQSVIAKVLAEPERRPAPEPRKPAVVPEKSEKPELPAALVKPFAKEAAQTGQKVVALVGLPQKDKAVAEATLARMRALIAPMQADPDALHGELIQTPEGWSPAVWPFASRQEAQLINATLIARGLRLRAVDF